jgi:hypothetical protein
MDKKAEKKPVNKKVEVSLKVNEKEALNIKIEIETTMEFDFDMVGRIIADRFGIFVPPPPRPFRPDMAQEFNP